MRKVNLSGEFAAFNTSKTRATTPINFLRETENCHIEQGEVVLRTKLASKGNIEQECTHLFNFEFGASFGADLRKLLVLNPTLIGPYIKVYSDNLVFESNVTGPNRDILEMSPTNHPHVDSLLLNDTLYLTESWQRNEDVDYPNVKFLIDVLGNTKFVNIGIEKPRFDATLTRLTGSGNWTEVGNPSYRFSYIYKDSKRFIEGNAREEQSIEILATTNRVQIQIPTPVNNGDLITGVRIYRRGPGASGSAGFGLINEAYPAFPYTFIDTGNNNIQQDLTIAPKIDHSQPLGCSVAVAYYNELVFFALNDGESLIFSKPAFPEAFPSQNLISVGSRDDKFIKLLPTKDFLIIVKQRSMWVLEGRTVAEFRLQKISNMGSLCPNFTVIHNNFLYFANESGIFKTTLFDEPINLATQIQETFNTAKLNLQGIKYWRAYVLKEKDLILFFLDRSSMDDYFKQILVFNPKTNLFVGQWRRTSTVDPKTRVRDIISWGNLENFIYLNQIPVVGGLEFVFNANQSITGQTTETVLPTVYAETGTLIPEVSPQSSKLFRHVFCLFSGLSTTPTVRILARTGPAEPNNLYDLGVRQITHNKIPKTIERYGTNCGIAIQIDSCPFDYPKWVGLSLEFEEVGLW